ncbi:hypothetical protein ACT3UJ_06355 [Halomonas sp. 86]|uniref:hypothetical protein n=1 Tax=unclassified Halomonas TaxID=2609666 RepID=UPI0040337267
MTSISAVTLRRQSPQKPTLELFFHPKATMPKRLNEHASRLGITAEQLVHRFISEGMRQHAPEHGEPGSLGTSMQDLLVRNGALAA